MLQNRFARACLEGRFAEATALRTEIAAKVAEVGPDVSGEDDDLDSLLAEVAAALTRPRSTAPQAAFQDARLRCRSHGVLPSQGGLNVGP